MTPSPAAREVLLALADDEICLGHWYATWVGLGPFLEEDLATTSIGQDELGHARALYALLDGGADAGDLDALAYGRRPEQFRSCWLAELPTERWEDLFARHLLHDEAEAVRWEAMLGSTFPGLGSLAQRALQEEAFHTRHARSLLRRLMAAGPEASARVGAAIARAMPLAVGIFEPTELDQAAVEEGVVSSTAAQQAERWRDRLDDLFEEVGLQVTWPPTPSTPGGRRGVRSPGFADLHAEMTKVYALDPTARW